MTVKIKDKELYEIYTNAVFTNRYVSPLEPQVAHVDTLWDKTNRTNSILATITTNNSMSDVKKVIGAILDGEKVEFEEQKYNLIIFKDSEAYHSVFYQFNNEINVIDDVKEYDLKRDAEYRFTQTEIDKYNKTNGLNVDLNAIKVPVEEIND